MESARYYVIVCGGKAIVIVIDRRTARSRVLTCPRQVCTRRRGAAPREDGRLRSIPHANAIGPSTPRLSQEFGGGHSATGLSASSSTLSGRTARRPRQVEHRKPCRRPTGASKIGDTVQRATPTSDQSPVSV